MDPKVKKMLNMSDPQQRLRSLSRLGGDATTYSISEEMDSRLTWWEERLAGAPPLLELPTDYPRPVVQSYRGASLRSRISPELTSTLKRLSLKNGATLS